MAKRVSKTDVKNTQSNLMNSIEVVLKALKLNFVQKKSGFEVAEREAIVYPDTVTNTFVVLHKTTGKQLFSNKSVNKLKSFLDGGKSDSKTDTKKADKPKKVKVPKEPKVRVPRYSDLKPVEVIKIDKPGVIKLASQPVELTSIKDMGNKVIEGFKGVFNKTQKKVVSVVSETYNLLPNKSVVDPILEFLEKNKVKYQLDRFTYVNDTNMRLHFTFPGIKIKDDSKDGILGGMFVHNSYNSTESFNMTAGALRLVCSNGMVVMQAFKRLKVIHQAHKIESIALANLESIFNGFYENSKMIESRIQELNSAKLTGEILAKLYPKIELRIFAHLLRDLGLLDGEQNNADAIEVMEELDPKQKLSLTQWQAYNVLTQYISHQTLQRYRIEYLRQVSKVFSI